MVEPAGERMDVEEFLRWSARQPDDHIYELVEGRPHAMVRPVLVHQLIVKNTCTAFDDELGDGPSSAFPEVLVEVAQDTFRVPDVTVLCEADDLSDRWGTDPTVLVEVLSPSTMDVDLYRKHEEYRAMPSLRHFAFVSADRPHVALWSRDADEWSVEEFEGLDAAVPFASVRATLPMARIYRRTGLT